MFFESAEHQRLKVHCAIEGVPMATWVHELVLVKLGAASQQSTVKAVAAPKEVVVVKPKVVEVSRTVPVKKLDAGWGDVELTEADEWEVELVGLDTEEIGDSLKDQARAKELLGKLRTTGRKIPRLQYIGK